MSEDTEDKKQLPVPMSQETSVVVAPTAAEIVEGTTMESEDGSGFADPEEAAEYLASLKAAPAATPSAAMPASLAKSQIAKSLWRKRDLSWKLEPHQLVAYNAIKAAGKHPNNRFVLNASRRWGKTYTMCCIAIEAALEKPNQLILYAGPTQKAVKDMIVPTFNDIFSDAPMKLRGQLKTQTNQYVFSNGSSIKVTGLDGGRLQRLRGMTAHMIVIDEAGFIDNLQTAVMSVLFPMTSTTGGQMILASNAPMRPQHDFIQVFSREAQETGNYLKQTVYDVKKFTKDDIDRFAYACGGYESTTFQREYLCTFMQDESNAVVPEWTKYRDGLVKDESQIKRPDFYYPIVAIDLGLIDFTGVLFGYWHFEKALLMIEDELLLKGINSEKLVKACRAKELVLWGEEPVKPPTRVADGQPYTINDLVTVHRYPVGSVGRDTLEAQVNAIRLDVQSGRLNIHPRCVNLLAQIEDATWDKNRVAFSRDVKNGHYDLVACLQYAVRHVNRHSNPYPPNYRQDTRNMVMKDPKFNNPTLTGLQKLFGQKTEQKQQARAVSIADIFQNPKNSRRRIVGN